MALNLKIIPSEKIVPLMDFQPDHVAGLEMIIRDSGAVRNPFLVAPTDDGRYILLDDGALLETARRLKIEYLPVQITGLGRGLNIVAEMAIDGWNKSYIDKFMEIFPRVISVRSHTNKPGQDFDHAKIIISENNGDQIRLCFGSGGYDHLPGSVFDFLKYLKRFCRFSRWLHLEKPDCVPADEINSSAVLKLPGLSSEDLLLAVKQNYLFPAELLAFECGSRMLGINYPVHILNEPVSVRDKEQFLHELISLRINSGCSRFISSGVYLLNY